MRFTVAIAAAFLLAAPHFVEADTGTATAAAPAAPAADLTAASFAAFAAQAGTMEIESSNLAVTRTGNEDVKQFAQQMVDDHTKAAKALKEIADQAKLSLPTTLEQSDQDKLGELRSAPADSFDNLYLRTQIAMHERAVATFHAYAEKGDNEVLRAFAADTLPVLEAHLRHAKGMAPAKSPS